MIKAHTVARSSDASISIAPHVGNVIHKKHMLIPVW